MPNGIAKTTSIETTSLKEVSRCKRADHRFWPEHSRKDLHLDEEMINRATGTSEIPFQRNQPWRPHHSIWQVGFSQAGSIIDLRRATSDIACRLSDLGGVLEQFVNHQLQTIKSETEARSNSGLRQRMFSSALQINSARTYHTTMKNRAQE